MGGTTKGGRGRLCIQSSLQRVAVVLATNEIDDFKFYIKILVEFLVSFHFFITRLDYGNWSTVPSLTPLV